MPVVPSGYNDFCGARGLSQCHPETWTEADHAAFVQWKRELVQAHRAFYESLGPLGEYELRSLAEDAADAEVRLTRNPYETCPCHPHVARPDAGWPREPGITRGDVMAWKKADPFARLSMPLPIARERIRRERDLSARPGAAAALAYIETFNSRRKSA